MTNPGGGRRDAPRPRWGLKKGAPQKIALRRGRGKQRGHGQQKGSGKIFGLEEKREGRKKNLWAGPLAKAEGKKKPPPKEKKRSFYLAGKKDDERWNWVSIKDM